MALKVMALMGTVTLFSLNAHAIGESEDELMQAQVTAARTRVSDFKNYLESVKQRKTEDVQAAEEIKRERAIEAEKLEVSRREFIRERNARPTNEAEQERLEAANDILEARQEEEMNQERLTYIGKRLRVRSIMEKEASIDENLEYGLSGDAYQDISLVHKPAK